MTSSEALLESLLKTAPRKRPMLAVCFPNGKTISGPVPTTERGVDSFIDQCGEPREGEPHMMDYNAYRAVLTTDSVVQLGDGSILDPDFLFVLSPSDCPFDVYWPQGILRAIGVSERLIDGDDDFDDC